MNNVIVVEILVTQRVKLDLTLPTVSMILIAKNLKILASAAYVLQLCICYMPFSTFTKLEVCKCTSHNSCKPQRVQAMIFYTTYLLIIIIRCCVVSCTLYVRHRSGHPSNKWIISGEKLLYEPGNILTTLCRIAIGKDL
jgi:hypothetical protein